MDECIDELLYHGLAPSEIEPMGFKRLMGYARRYRRFTEAELRAYKAWKVKHGIKD